MNVHPYPITEAIHFLKWNTSLNTDNAEGQVDPNFDDTVLVSYLRDPDGEEVAAVVYLSEDGQHDFESGVL